MSLKRKISGIVKRGFKYIIHGVPVKNITANIAVLAPSELLKGRTALITGGTSGIGYEIAKAYVNAGATVVITGRNIERVNKARLKLQVETGVTQDSIMGLELDNSKVSEFENKINELQHLLHEKKIDILVNNAGLIGGGITNTTEEEYDSVMDTNLKGVFFLSKIISQSMIKNNIKGNILNIASSSSLRPGNSAYILSKWGIRSLTLGLAKSLTPHGIIVNGIAPGPTATPMLCKENVNNLSLPINPSGRFITPEEIANMAVIMTSNMGRSIVGDIIYMTGGSGIITYDDMKYTI